MVKSWRILFCFSVEMSGSMLIACVLLFTWSNKKLPHPAQCNWGPLAMMPAPHPGHDRQSPNLNDFYNKHWYLSLE